jgi:hypothetical protein
MPSAFTTARRRATGGLNLTAYVLCMVVFIVIRLKQVRWVQPARSSTTTDRGATS